MKVSTDDLIKRNNKALHRLHVDLKIIIEILSSLIDAYANQNDIATTTNLLDDEI